MIINAFRVRKNRTKHIIIIIKSIQKIIYFYKKIFYFYITSKHLVIFLFFSLNYVKIRQVNTQRKNKTIIIIIIIIISCRIMMMEHQNHHHNYHQKYTCFLGNIMHTIKKRKIFLVWTEWILKVLFLLFKNMLFSLHKLCIIKLVDFIA